MHAVWNGAQPALGTFVFLRDAASTEIALTAGHDFTILDLEHTTLDLHDAVSHQRAADSLGAPMLVRLPGFDHSVLGRLLDAGVSGAMLPHFGLDADDAVAFVRTLRYAPVGTRPSCSGVRAARYALGSFAEYTEEADRVLAAVGLVEDIQAVDGLEALLERAPVNALMPGPGDLSTSMGLPGQPRHPRVQEAIGRIADIAHRAGIRLGFYLNSPDDVAMWRHYEPAFYVNLFDTKILAQAQRAGVDVIRGRMAQAPAAA